MRKIISLICVVAVLVTTLVSMGMVASAADKPSIALSALATDTYVEDNGTKYLYANVTLTLPELSQPEDVGEEDYEYVGKVLSMVDFTLTWDTSVVTYQAKKTTSPNDEFKPSKVGDDAGKYRVAFAPTSPSGFYYGGDLVWKLCFKVVDTTKAPNVQILIDDNTLAAATIITYDHDEDLKKYKAENCVIYKDANAEATKFAVANEAIVSYDEYTTGGATESAYNVTYAATKGANDKELVVWGNTPATTETTENETKNVTFTAEPAFGYMINKVNGEEVINKAGGEYTVAVTANDTVITVEVAAIDTKVIATKYVDAENGKTYIFGKANFAATDCGVALTKGGVAVPAYVDGAYKADGKYAATANANGAFGVAFTFNSVNGLFDGISATAYADGESAAAIALN